MGESDGSDQVERRRALREVVKPEIEVAGITHRYRTWNDGPWSAAIADVRDELQQPATRRALRAAARTRRWGLDRRAG